MAKKYIWLKLQKDFFKRKEIKKLRKLAGGAVYTIIYLEMQLLSLENDGKLYFEGVEDNFIDEMALTLDESVEDVQMTMLFLQKHGLIEIGQETDEYILPDVVENIGSETASAERVRKHRQKKKLLQSNIIETKLLSNETAKSKKVTSKIGVDFKNLENTKSFNDVLQSNDVVINGNTEREKEKDIEREKEKDIEREKEEDEKDTFLAQLSKMAYVEKLKTLKGIIMKVTGKDENSVNLIFRPAYYTDVIDDVLIAIRKSRYLSGKLEDRKPNLNTFTVKAQIDRILAGAYEDFKTKEKATATATIDGLRHKGATADDLMKEIGL